MLVFDPNNWNQPQTVTVAAIEDDVSDADATIEISHSALSSDPHFDKVPVSNVPVHVRDNELGSLLIQESDGATTVVEGAAGDTYEVTLRRQPQFNVTVTLALADGDSGQLTVSESENVFTPSDWDQPRTVSVSAADDGLSEGLHVARIVHTLSSSDPDFAA